MNKLTQRHVKITKEQDLAAKKDRKRGNALSAVVRQLLQKHYRKEGLL